MVTKNKARKLREEEACSNIDMRIITDAGHSWSLCELFRSLGVGRREEEEEQKEEGRTGATGLEWKGLKMNKA